MNKLISLDGFNELALKKYQQDNTKNSIACPNCGQELNDTYPNIILTSNPPQKNIHCNNCRWVGYRYA